MGELFLDRSDELVLAFDAIMTAVMQWQPNEMAAAKHSVVFTNKKAWLIVKPMKKELDVKFYVREMIHDPLVRKTTSYGNKHAHHLRVASENQVTSEVVRLLRLGFDYAMED